MKRSTIIIASLLASASHAQQAPISPPTVGQPVVAAAQTAFTQSPAYTECTALASSNPAAAEAKAAEWLKIDDGVGAHHCRAMAWYGQRRFADAATELSVVRNKIAPENITLRSYVARQASKAWLDASRPDGAIAVLTTQINELAAGKNDNVIESKLTAELLLDRARVHGTYGQFSEAVQDLDHAVSLAPANEEVLVERARAFANLGDVALAKQDLALALRLNPAHPDALALQQKLQDTTANVPAGQALKPLR